MKKSVRRLLIPVVAVLVILAVAWVGGWFWLAQWADRKASATLAELAERGLEVECRDRGVTGFPFALRLACAETAVAERSTETKASFAGLTGGASILAPMTARVAMTSPARVDSPIAGTADMRWENASLGVGLGMNGPRDVTFDTSDLEANLAVPELPVEKLVARSAEGSLAPSANGGSDIAVRFTDLGLSMGDAALPAISGSAAAELSVPPRALANGRASLQAPVWARNIDIAFQSGGAAFRAEGEIAVDAEGLVDGELTLRIAGAEALPTLIAALPRAWQRKANGAVGGLFLLGTPTTLEGKPASELTLKIEKSDVSISGVEIVTLPRLQL